MYFPVKVTELGIVIEVKLQLQKAPLPIDLTELGMVIEVKLSHLEKALLPIEVTELGIVIEVKLLQFQKASSSIDLIELGIVIEVKRLQKYTKFLYYTIQKFHVFLHSLSDNLIKGSDCLKMTNYK